MALTLYNTLSHTTETFTPREHNMVRLYACGPTVYDAAHIGNFRSYLLSDILVRTLSVSGYQVDFIQNITDVGHLVGDGDRGEDKMQLASTREKQSSKEIAERYFTQFREDAAKLNLIPPREWVRASDYIKEQIAFIEALETQGYTYRIDDGIYFDTSRSSDYTKLSGHKMEDLHTGARIEVNPQKRSPADFALWKFTPAGVERELEWDSPWGRGFPGWHIECSAMSSSCLGEDIDIHTGGVDSISPHHTNERAQNRARFDRETVRFWMHSEFLLVDGRKMSKSLGNAYTVTDLEERGFHPLSFRYFTLQAHYQQKLNFTWDALSAAQNAYERLLSTARSLIPHYTAQTPLPVAWEERLRRAWEDNLNMPLLLAETWTMLKDSSLSDGERASLLLYSDAILGFDFSTQSKEVPEEVLALARQRVNAREAEDWTLADELRAKIESLGYSLSDTAEGPRIERRLKS